MRPGDESDSLMPQRCDMLHDLFKMIADVAVDWDGKDPIRMDWPRG